MARIGLRCWPKSAKPAKLKRFENRKNAQFLVLFALKIQVAAAKWKIMEDDRRPIKRTGHTCAEPEVRKRVQTIWIGATARTYRLGGSNWLPVTLESRRLANNQMAN